MTAAEHAIHVLKLIIQYNNDADPDDCRLALQVIEQQAQEIERLNDKTDAMRCCGNCANHHIVINESKCFAGLPQDEWRFSTKAKFTSADSVCDEWKWPEKETEGV